MKKIAILLSMLFLLSSCSLLKVEEEETETIEETSVEETEEAVDKPDPSLSLAEIKAEEEEEEETANIEETEKSNEVANNEWLLVAGEPPVPDREIRYEGEVTLTGTLVYKPAYVGEPVAHFHVADESLTLIPEFIRGHEFQLTAFVEGEERNQPISASVADQFAEYTEESPATIIVDTLTVYMEGSPRLNLLGIVD